MSESVPKTTYVLPRARQTLFVQVFHHAAGQVIVAFKLYVFLRVELATLISLCRDRFVAVFRRLLAFDC